MQILKKSIINKITINNYLNTYKIFLKNLNFFNNFKKRNNILIKDILLLKLDNLYLLNINLKENFFFLNLENNENFFKNKNNLLYFFEYYDQYLKKMTINTKYENFLYYKFYINFLNKKLKKFYISKIFLKKNNKVNKLYLKKFNLYLKGYIFRRKTKKKVLIGFYGKIKKIKNKYIYIKNKKIYLNIKSVYLRKKLKYKISFFNIFNNFLAHKKFIFKYNIKLIQKKKMKFYYLRKKYINNLQKKINLQKINSKNFYKYIYFKKFKNLKKIY
jgi:hypothetical protein